MLAIGLGYSLVFGSHGLPLVRELRADLEVRSAEAYRRIETNAGLHRRLAELRSDEEAMEREARDTLGFVRPDEVVFVMGDPPSGPPSR